jgi:hypothetical protein
MSELNNLKHHHEMPGQPESRIRSRREMLKIFGAAGAALLGSGLSGLDALAQPMGGPPPWGPGGESTALAEAFKGITTNGTVIPGLFPIYSTGVSTKPVLIAAQAFISSLTDSQRAAALFDIEDEEWRKWNNVDMYQRQGVGLRDMTDIQKKAAFELLSAALSAKGLELARNIMKLNTTEGELLSQLSRFNENLYWFTIMGTPSDTEPWGFQLDGHHLIINYFILGDQVVMSPAFFGSEPPVAKSGAYKGVSVLQKEQDEGLAMINSLNEEQRVKAIVQTSKTGNNLVAGAFQDNLIVDYIGIQASTLASIQQEQLLDLVALWVNNMRDEHARVKMKEIKEHLAKTSFGWVGGIDRNAVFYYRIQSPVILIEFDHELPGPLGQVQPSSVPSRNHIHSIVRTPNGNDYGKALLRQHLLTHPHHHIT